MYINVYVDPDCDYSVYLKKPLKFLHAIAIQCTSLNYDFVIILNKQSYQY